MDQINSNPIFGAIFLFLGAYFLYIGYLMARMEVDYAIDSTKKALLENRAEVYFTVILALMAGFIYVTGTFTFVDNFIRIPKISYNYYLLMVFLWPVIGTETIVYILSVYSRYTLHLPFIGPLLKIAVLIFEIIYLLFLSRIFVRLMGIKKGVVKNRIN
ncbi:MAG: hypothetical protein ACE5J5_08030 [Candidatus Hydrothermarchaeales archaeon]